MWETLNSQRLSLALPIIQGPLGGHDGRARRHQPVGCPTVDQATASPAVAPRDLSVPTSKSDDTVRELIRGRANPCGLADAQPWARREHGEQAAVGSQEAWVR